MTFEHDGIMRNNLLAPFYTGQMIKEDIAVFMDVLKVNGRADGIIQVLPIFLQNYSTLMERELWDHLTEDVKFVGPVEELPMCELEYQLAVNDQDMTKMGVMNTNGQYRSGKGILVRGGWKDTNETYFVLDPNELQQEVSEQLQVPGGGILYQAVTVNIHNTKSNTCIQEVIEDLNSYSIAEDRQGGLQVTRSWKDSVQEGIEAFTKPDGLGMWNWDENHFLGNIKMYTLGWRTSIRAVYKNICNGSPARDYMLTHLYVNLSELADAYNGAPGIIDMCVEEIFWMFIGCRSREKMR
jgi:hypothetical protein